MIISMQVSQRGGLVFRIVLIMATLVLVMVAINFYLQYQKNHNDVAYRKATEMADFGLQKGLESFGETKKPVTISKMIVDEGYYSVASAMHQRNDSTIVILTSVGGFGSSVITRTCSLYRAVVNEDTVWSRLSLE